MAGIRGAYAWGLLEFPSNYSSSLVARLTKLREADPEDVEYSIVNVTMDMSSKFTFLYPVYLIQFACINFIS